MPDIAVTVLRLLPKAVAWAEQCSTEILRTGNTLSSDEIAVAKAVGVAEPHRIRVALVDAIPLPQDEQLRIAALQAGLLGPGALGLTLGHGIYIRRGHASPRLMAHEPRHVHQYEAAGSIAAFLPTYLAQLLEYGYSACPFEVDARTHEVAASLLRNDC